MAKDIEGIIERAKNARPIAEVNGRPVYTFEDQRAIAERDALLNKQSLTPISLNPDGSPASSFIANTAVNADRFFDNRFRLKVTEEGTFMQIVTAETPVGYRAISEQATGNIFQKQLPAYEIHRDSKSKKLVVDKILTISDDEFVTDFTQRLNNKDAAEVYMAIQAKVKEDISEATMPI